MIAWVSLSALRIRSICAGSAASAGALVAVSSVHEAPGLTVALLCFALSIGWARVYLRRHTPAQVFVGALTAAPIALLT